MSVASLARAFRAGRHGIVYAAPRRLRRREVALTFDDGPSEWTPQILDVLGEAGARGTFFVLGCAVPGSEHIVERTITEGHELGNHAYTHLDPSTLRDDELRAELEHTNATLEAVAGRRPIHFRPPYGTTDYRVADVARSVGFTRTVLRSVDPADWNESDADLIAKRILAGIRPGSIVCLHDALPPREPMGLPTREPTVAALARVVPELARRGFRCVTVMELLAWNPR
jgi:peptidoglycan/xylan/chitin deacetylase (PgdA/CDA1 family)